jgi:hypothetical protein
MSSVPATDDPRWIAFNKDGLTCSCGERHVGLFPINIGYPINYPGSKTYEDNAALTLDRDFLSWDYNVWGFDHFAMRMRLPLQIAGAPPWAFMFTIWGALGIDTFKSWIEARKTGRIEPGMKAKALIANQLAGFKDTTLNLKGTAFLDPDNGPPILLIHGPQPDTRSNHPLISEQRNGISIDRMFDLFTAYGHDMRGAL